MDIALLASMLDSHNEPNSLYWEGTEILLAFNFQLDIFRPSVLVGSKLR